MPSVLRGDCCPIGIDIGTQSIHIAEAKHGLIESDILCTEVVLNQYSRRKTL